jgi:polysaccharide pyruvyl transferase
MRYASFRYGRSWNLGDEIQTLAAERHLPRVDARIDRDSLASFRADEPHVVIFQGWFSMAPERCFPPSRAIVPVFVGFHITETFGSVEYFLTGDRLAYLKAHEPIGCRDDSTRQLLERAGVRAYTTQCLTLTLPTRQRKPRHGKVFIVDGDDLPIPRWLRRRAVHVTQVSSATLGDEEKRAAAQRLLDLYRDEARLVVTTRLHCALPCLAMGIPVVFFGDPDDDRRLGILRDLRVPIARRSPRSPLSRKVCRRLRVARWGWRLWIRLTVHWRPRPLDLRGEKERLGEVVRREVQRASDAATLREAGVTAPYDPLEVSSLSDGNGAIGAPVDT